MLVDRSAGVSSTPGRPFNSAANRATLRSDMNASFRILISSTLTNFFWNASSLPLSSLGWVLTVPLGGHGLCLFPPGSSSGLAVRHLPRAATIPFPQQDRLSAAALGGARCS